jgi:hypothetical protein
MLRWNTQSLVRVISMRFGLSSLRPSCDSGPELTQATRAKQAGATIQAAFMGAVLVTRPGWTRCARAGSGCAQ